MTTAPVPYRVRIQYNAANNKPHTTAIARLCEYG